MELMIERWSIPVFAWPKWTGNCTSLHQAEVWARPTATAGASAAVGPCVLSPWEPPCRPCFCRCVVQSQLLTSFDNEQIQPDS